MSSIVAARRLLTASLSSSSSILESYIPRGLWPSSPFLLTTRPFSSSSMNIFQWKGQQEQYPQKQQRRCFSRTYNLLQQQEEEMKDEYGEMTDDGESFVQQNFVLENNVVLPRAELRYQTYGKLNEAKDNVVVVCHALTGNASLHSWWGSLLGDGKAFDTSKYFIVCCNILGSCYGSTNPQSINPETGIMYGKDFPDISVKDTVRLQLKLLQEQIGVKSVKSVIGGSFGGMQAMEFAVQGGISGGDFVTDTGSPFVRSVVPIACGAAHTAWQIAISEVQRQAIYSDPNWESDPFHATKGLEVARQMGMISYRTPTGYENKFGRHLQSTEGGDTEPPAYGSNAPWQVKSYLEYQGIKFIDRFDPITYVKLTEQMDSHDIARSRGSTLEEVLKRIEIPACVLGIDSDVLYPLAEQEYLAEHMPNSELKIIRSLDGHDGFLLEQDQVGHHIVDFLDKLS
ncbi:homoserine O-acetyltransferase [Nitzschia inconspicua]|uniref:Homoserine O-acetyltransferase n=1 Tax=Nitzschia inconspicua TaxID=303405 RepID=A0A9K3PPW7_9STRA|nr:homoserine O-acetyltransferase [Nitzschia inconspicua]